MTAAQAPVGSEQPPPRLLAVMREPFLDSLPGLMSLLGFLAEAGWEVRVLTTADPRFEAPAFAGSVQVRTVPSTLTVGPLRLRITATAALAMAAVRTRLRWRPRVILAAGHYGAIAATVAGMGRGARRARFVIELPGSGGARGVAGVLARIDAREMRAADLVIVQDGPRGRFLAERFDIDASRIALLPNARRGGVRRAKGGVFGRRFGIPASRRIALHAGGLGAWCQSLELVRGASRWPERWHLVLHTRFRLDPDDRYAASVRREAAAVGVSVSEEPVRDEAIDELFSSADVGLALYAERHSPAARLMGLASGKIAGYLKCGLPVVATALPTVREFIEAYGCGICVESVEEIPGALAAIDADYDRFRENAFRCFEELFDPEPRCRDIERRLRGMSGAG